MSEYIKEYAAYSDSSSGYKLSRDIRSFVFLPKGWDFGVGDPIEPKVIDKALEIVESGFLLNLQVEAIPEINGGIVLTFVYGEDSVEVRIHNDLTYDIIYERGLGLKFETLYRLSNIDEEAVVIYWLNRLRNNLKAQYTCESLGDSPKINIASVREDSKFETASTNTKTTPYRLCA